MTISTFILAIALVESGNNPKAVGKAGELSEYQITRQVWEEYTIKPFTKANGRNQVISKYVAFQHAVSLEEKVNGNWGIEMRVILRKLPQAERDTVLLCAAGWHRGERYMRRPMGRWSKETRDYSDRVWNTYERLKKEGK
jgi:hypothetical protein